VKYGYGFEWTPGLVLLGLVVVLPIVPGLALIGLVIAAGVAVAALVAVAGVIFATPYLLVRTVLRRLAERHQSAEGSAPITTAVARAATATHS
jgi:hypothetical protein